MNDLTRQLLTKRVMEGARGTITHAAWGSRAQVFACYALWRQAAVIRHIVHLHICVRMWQARELMTRLAEAGLLCPSRYLTTLIAHDCLASSSPIDSLCLEHISQLHPQLHLPSLAASLNTPPQTPEQMDQGNSVSSTRPGAWSAARLHYANMRKSVLHAHPAQRPAGRTVSIWETARGKRAEHYAAHLPRMYLCAFQSVTCIASASYKPNMGGKWSAPLISQQLGA